MQNDYTVEKIVNVFHNIDTTWRRDEPKSREYDAALIFLDGSIEYYFPGETVTVRRQDIFMLPKNVPYSGKRLSDVVEYICIDFVSGDKYDLQNSAFPTVTHANDFDFVKNSFFEILKIYEDQRSDAPLLMKSLLYSIFSKILQNDILPTSDRTENILMFIKNNFSDSSLGIPMICSKFLISESQLRREIKYATSLSPNNYIRTLRINKAKNQLISTNLKINEISNSCGFESPYYFSKCFRDFCGLSPKMFREKFSLCE